MATITLVHIHSYYIHYYTENGMKLDFAVKKLTGLADKKFTEPGAEAPVLPHRALFVLC